jgi:hypothetical protein
MPDRRIYIMSEQTNEKQIMCPWCHNSLDIIRSGKSGLHYANCGSCNAHFRNIPLTLIGTPDNSTAARKIDNVPVSPSADNAKFKSDKERELEKLRKGIPRNLWRYLPGAEDEDDNE